VDCDIWVYFQGWREGCRDPKVRVEPVMYDFGTVGWQGQVEAEFTVYNDAHSEYGDPLTIIAGPTFEDHTNFIRDWDKWVFGAPIPAGGSEKIHIIYKPTEWNIEHSTNMWFDCNDPDMPHVTVPLVGRASSNIPKIEIFIEGECEIPPDDNPGRYMCFPEQKVCTGESEPQYIEIKNIGSEDLKISIPNTNSGRLSGCLFSFYYENIKLIGTSWEKVIYPGDSIMIDITFHPDRNYGNNCPEVGVVCDSFNIHSNDPNNEEETIRFYGYMPYTTEECIGVYCP